MPTLHVGVEQVFQLRLDKRNESWYKYSIVRRDGLKHGQDLGAIPNTSTKYSSSTTPCSRNAMVGDESTHPDGRYENKL